MTVSTKILFEVSKPHRLVRGDIFYHGSNSGILDASTSGKKHDHPSSVFGIFFTTDEYVAKTYGKKLTVAKLKCKKVYRMTYDEVQSFENKKDALKLKNKLISQGYDSIWIFSLDYASAGQIAVFKESDIEVIDGV